MGNEGSHEMLDAAVRRKTLMDGPTAARERSKSLAAKRQSMAADHHPAHHPADADTRRVSVASAASSAASHASTVNMKDANATEASVKAYLEREKAIFNRKWKHPPTSDKRVTDFDLLRKLGQGAFGTVLLVREHGRGEDFYAMKVMGKKQVVKNKMVDNIKQEKKVLECNDFPFLVHLNFAFQDNANLYLVLAFINGGEMFQHLQKKGRFDEATTRLYSAEVLLAFEYLHYMDLVYRDLKPENLLIDATGHCKVTDFGFCKRITKGRTYTLCGTPDYFAPELILSKGYGKSVDYWALGILMFEMAAGFPPFSAEDEMQLYDNICTQPIKFPKYFRKELRSLIGKLTTKNTHERYGVLKAGVQDIKMHDWFDGLDWAAVYHKRIMSPLQPTTTGAGDASNFRKTKMVDPALHSQAKDQYKHLFDDF